MSENHPTWEELDAVRRETAPPEAARAAAAHVRDCGACASAMARLAGEDRELLDALAPPSASPEAVQEAETAAALKFRELRTAGAIRPRRPWGAMIPLAAAAALGVALLAGVVRTPPVQPAPLPADPVALALADLDRPALSARATRTLLKYGRKALPALRTAEAGAQGERLDRLAAVRSLIEHDWPRVLLVYSHPRYEYQALSDYLLNDPGLLTHRLQLSADPELTGAVSAWAAAAPDRVPARFRAPAGLPSTIEELAEYDAIVAGDSSAEDLGPLAGLLGDFVEKLGGSLVLVAGPDSSKTGSLHRACAAFLPVELADAPAREGSIRVKLTDEGRTDACLAVETAGQTREEFFAEVPSLRWVQPVKVRPEAHVLLATEDGTPVVAASRRGRGRVAWVGSDDLYMWRGKVGGGKYHQPFYRALITGMVAR